ncbi:MAG: hypothetical protein WC378_14245 [Opitutaceae bacterium]|jgi:O-antigen/teichoic acid export membrane protein
MRLYLLPLAPRQYRQSGKTGGVSTPGRAVSAGLFRIAIRAGSDHPHAMPKMSDPSPSDSTRWRVLWQTVGASGLSRVVSAVFTLAQVPVALHALGADSYGFLCTALVFGAAVNFADLGIGSILQTALSSSFGREDDPRLKIRFSTGFALHLALAIFWLALLAPLPWLVNWAGLLNLDSTTAAHVPAGISAAVIALTLGLPLTTAPRLALAVRMGWIQPMWIALGNALLWATFCVAALTGAGFPFFVFIACMTPVLVNVAVLIHVFVKLGWPWRLMLSVDLQESKMLLKGASLYALPQVATGILSLGLPAMLSRSGGPAAVTVYQVVQRIFGLFTQAHTILATPFWPAFAEAAARRDHAWVRKAYLRLWQLTAGLFWPGLAAAALFMNPVLKLWLKGGAPMPSTAFVIWMAAWSAAQTAGQILQIFLLGLSQLRSLSLFSVTGSLLAFAGIILGGRLWGPTGIIACVTLGFALGGLAGMFAGANLTLRQLGEERA